MVRRIKHSSEGQTSLDFLIGITLFLLVFIFVFAFIPKMFMPFQTNSDELTMTADRAAGTLVENVLVDSQHNDNHVVLVYDGADNPSIINAANIRTLRSDFASDPDAVKRKLGLVYQKSYGGSSSATDQYYNLQVQIAVPDGTTFPIGTITATDLLAIPNADQPVGANIGQSKRFVYIADDSAPVRYVMAILTVRVW